MEGGALMPTTHRQSRALAIQQSANTHDPGHPTIVDLYPESLTPLPET